MIKTRKHIQFIEEEHKYLNTHTKEEYANYKFEEAVNHLPDCKYYHYSLQLNLYAYFIEQEFGYNCIGKTLLWINRNNPNKISIKLIPVDDYSNEVELILIY